MGEFSIIVSEEDKLHLVLFCVYIWLKNEMGPLKYMHCSREFNREIDRIFCQLCFNSTFCMCNNNGG